MAKCDKVVSKNTVTGSYLITGSYAFWTGKLSREKIPQTANVYTQPKILKLKTYSANEPSYVVNCLSCWDFSLLSGS